MEGHYFKIRERAVEKIDASGKQITSFRELFYPRLMEDQTQYLSAEARSK